MNQDSIEHRQIFDYSEQPTGSKNKIMHQVEEVGVYIPENMSNNREMPHVFAMDNLDWRKNTLTSEQRNTLPSGPSTSIPTICISAKNRQISRSLGNIMDVDNLHTRADRTSEYMLLVYRLGRAATISQLLDMSCKIESGLPGFSMK